LQREDFGFMRENFNLNKRRREEAKKKKKEEKRLKRLNRSNEPEAPETQFPEHQTPPTTADVQDPQ
jgi:hypothetical protein